MTTLLKPSVEPVPSRLGLLSAWLPRIAVALIFVSKPVALYDTWNRTRRQMIGTLAAGDKVIGVTGVVITFKPGIIPMDRDYSVPESSGPTPAQARLADHSPSRGQAVTARGPAFLGCGG
jgi:hypothetical protein